MDAAGVIATYVLDGNQPLTAESGGNTTFYLYGLGGIGEETNAWSYSLPDGTNTPRQLTDIQGGISLSARYTPWGDMLELNGTGNFTFGYLGGILDATTNLIYVGNGQYYDPSTGRFLTRDVNPDSTNPYVPWNPIGALLGPLGVVALIFGRRKKGSKTGTFLVLLLVMVTVGMTLSACGGGGGGVTTTLPSVPPSGGTPMPGAGTVTGNGTPNPGSPTISPTTTPCPTPTLTNTPTPTSTSTPTPTATPTNIQLAISYLLQYSQVGAAAYNYTVSEGIPIKDNTQCSGSSQGKNKPILVPPASCSKGSPTYIAGTIAHEVFHIQTASKQGSLWEEYQAMQVGDIVRNDIIQAGYGTSADMRHPLSDYTVNITNSNKNQLSQDLTNWFLSYKIEEVYVLTWQVQPLP